MQIDELELIALKQTNLQLQGHILQQNMNALEARRLAVVAEREAESAALSKLLTDAEQAEDSAQE